MNLRSRIAPALRLATFGLLPSCQNGPFGLLKSPFAR